MLSKKELREETESLLSTAMMLEPESEGMTIDDSYEVDEIVQLRSHLSTMRRSIDIINKGLAKLWLQEFPNIKHDDEFTTWYLGQSKGKKILDASAFFAWVATLEPERLEALFSASAVKVGGMTETERMTFLDETPTNAGLSIQNKPRR